MKPSKTGDGVGSTIKATTKYGFVAPCAIRKGRGRGLRSMISLGVSGDGLGSFRPSSLYASKSTNPLALEKETMQSDYLVPTDGQGLRMNKYRLVNAKKHIQLEITLHPSIDHMQYTLTVETSAIWKGRGRGKSMLSLQVSGDEVGSRPTSTISDSTRQDSAISAGQGMWTMNKKPLVFEEEHMETDTTLPPSTDQVKTNVGSCTTGKVKKVRGKNKSKAC